MSKYIICIYIIKRIVMLDMYYDFLYLFIWYIYIYIYIYIRSKSYIATPCFLLVDN
ncbi:MAG: hypothetical protein N7Q72_01265 [Spiroplasma sp. Tabriz.8]|nr:hypothetical protein [Spiroplasma sp. Tabriz.8]